MTASTALDCTKPASMDAIAMLEADHDAVRQLFARYEQARSVLDRKALVAEICTVLSVHVQIDEEIFYPAVKPGVKDRLLVPVAAAARTGMKDLIALLQSEPDGEGCDAKVKVLSEYVKHLAQEELDLMFPEARASSFVMVDMIDLGARMAARKDDLLAQTA